MFVGNTLSVKNSCSKMPWLITINSFEEKGRSISHLVGHWQGSLETPTQAKPREARPLPFRAAPAQGNTLGWGQLWKGSALVGTEPKSISSSVPRSPERMSQLQGPEGVGRSWDLEDPFKNNPSALPALHCETALPEFQNGTKHYRKEIIVFTESILLRFFFFNIHYFI